MEAKHCHRVRSDRFGVRLVVLKQRLLDGWAPRCEPLCHLACSLQSLRMGLDSRAGERQISTDASFYCKQATQGYLKLPNGRALTGQSHDYKPHGTTTLFAALEVATGKIIATHSKRRQQAAQLAAVPDAFHLTQDHLMFGTALTGGLKPPVELYQDFFQLDLLVGLWDVDAVHRSSFSVLDYCEFTPPKRRLQWRPKPCRDMRHGARFRPPARIGQMLQRDFARREVRGVLVAAFACRGVRAVRFAPFARTGTAARSARMRSSNTLAGSSFGCCGTSSPRNALAGGRGRRA